MSNNNLEPQQAQGPFYRTLSPEEMEDIASRILYEDNHLFVINKKIGEIVQGDNTGDEPITEAIKAFIAQRDGKAGRVYLGLPHRLDRPVSGIVVLAKTSKALERMNALFRDGNVKKIYWALVEHEPSPKAGEIRSFLLRNEQQNKTYSKPVQVPGSKEAVLNYRLLRPTTRYFLVEIDLITGRHHQIRSQLASIGCCIKGDLKYGARRSNPDGGICLHSRSVTFMHPVKHEQIYIEAPTYMEGM